MRALTKLKEAGIASLGSGERGRLPEMPLDLIHPDPNNARRPEDESSPKGIEEQRELTQDIKARGVKSPVSLRQHPTKPGQYMLNFGHRRLKAVFEAGLKTIPYFLDEDFNSYDQVKENLLHRRPSVWALAEFVKRKLDAKQSKADIAAGLGKSNQNFVTELLALVDAPSCLHLAYSNGVRSTRTLYDLRRAYDEFPEQIETWCGSDSKIARPTIQKLLEELRSSAPFVLNEHSSTLPTNSSDTLPYSMEGQVSSNDERICRSSDQKSSSGSALKASLHSQSSPVLKQTVGRNSSNGTSESQFVARYKGKRAIVEPDTMVQVTLEGKEVPEMVRLVDLNFEPSAHSPSQ